MAASWWRPWRVGVAGFVAVAVAACAFVYRFNTLGGTLGGFDNDHFIYLVRTDMLLEGGQPLRDFADAELRGAWPALTYAVSAWAQQLGGRNLLSEAYLTTGLLALAYAVVFLTALDLSKRWSVALLAVASAVVTAPKLYNYQKVLVLALGLLALRAVALRPSLWRLAAAAAVTAVATLFRHDYGLYVAAGVVAAVAARDRGGWSAGARHAATYAAFTGVCLLPSVVWVQYYAGLREYVASSAASVTVERARTQLTLPAFDSETPLSPDNLELVTYYAFWAVAAVAVLVLVLGIVRSSGGRWTNEDRATGLGLLVVTLLVTMSFLRANLAERFGDAAAAVVLLAAWTAGVASLHRSVAVRRAVLIVPLLLLLETFGAAYVLSDTTRELDTSGLSDSWEKIVRRYGSVRGELSGLPPVAWPDDVSTGTLGAARYLAECTTPGDRVLVVGAVHEIPVLARRRFAAGQAMFKLSLYTSDADQQRALARLTHESVPVVLADASDFDEGFVSDYPLVARYVAARYREAGTIDVDREPRFRVLVATDRRSLRTDQATGLPCFR